MSSAEFRIMLDLNVLLMRHGLPHNAFHAPVEAVRRAVAEELDDGTG